MGGLRQSRQNVISKAPGGGQSHCRCTKIGAVPRWPFAKSYGGWLLAAAICWLGLGSAALAQGPAPPLETPSPRPEPAATEQAEFGLVLKAQGGGFKNLTGTLTIPTDWPNQQRVRIVKEEIPEGASVAYQSIDNVGRQMVVKIPLLPAGREVRAVVTFAVETLRPPPSAQDTAKYRAP